MKISVKSKYLLILLSIMLMLPMAAYAEPEHATKKKLPTINWTDQNIGRKYNRRIGSYNRTFGYPGGGFRRINIANPHITEKIRISANALIYHTDNGSTLSNPELWRPAISVTYLLPACRYANWRFEGNVGYIGNKKPYNFQSIYVEPYIGANLYPHKTGGFYFTLGGSLYMTYILENDHIDEKFVDIPGSGPGCKDIAQGFGITPMLVGGFGCDWRVGKKSSISLEATIHIAAFDWKAYNWPGNIALSMDGQTSNKNIWFFFVGSSGIVSPNFYAQLSLSYSFDLPTHRRAINYK